MSILPHRCAASFLLTLLLALLFSLSLCRAQDVVTASPDSDSEWPSWDLDAPEGTYIVVGEPRMREFAEYLASNPETRVSRLLLSDSAMPPSTPKDKDKPDAEACQTIRTLAFDILHHTQVNASLSSLSYLAYTCPSTGSFLDQDLGFPNLTHLTLGSADVWQHQDALFRLTSLNYLHCAEAGSGFEFHDHAAPSIAAVLQALPHLTHLRVSGVQREEDVPALPGGLLSTGIGLVDGLGGWLRQAVFGAMVPANFTLLLQAGPNPGRNDNDVQYHSFVWLLEERARAAAAAGAQWVRVQHYVPSADDDDGDDVRGSNLRWVFPLERAVAEFLANGEEGVWGVLDDEKLEGETNEKRQDDKKTKATAERRRALATGAGLWSGGDMPFDNDPNVRS
ncbi:hypothetical protein B0H13DRAFT_2022253 [Mycena leptocephala]|nr:hypothetical protein B0H13DRAFT_2022253 [Mycena leptocephala]